MPYPPVWDGKKLPGTKRSYGHRQGDAHSRDRGTWAPARRDPREPFGWEIWKPKPHWETKIYFLISEHVHLRNFTYVCGYVSPPKELCDFSKQYGKVLVSFIYWPWIMNNEPAITAIERPWHWGLDIYDLEHEYDTLLWSTTYCIESMIDPTATYRFDPKPDTMSRFHYHTVQAEAKNQYSFLFNEMVFPEVSLGVVVGWIAYFPIMRLDCIVVHRVLLAAIHWLDHHDERALLSTMISFYEHGHFRSSA